MLISFLSAAAALTIGFWIPVKAELAQVLLDRAWREVRSGQSNARPWPWADTSPIAELRIPSLDADWIVLSGSSGRNLAFAPAHMDGSAAPGARGVTVIAGHRDTHFEVLQTLAPGAELLLVNRAGESFRYRVSAIEIVDARTTRLRLDAERPVLVLATCYPFDALIAGGPMRLLVWAEAATD
jgi:sortase A